MLRERLDFLLLGPLEVRSGEESLVLGGLRQRSVLALLLLHANEVVSRDTLLDQIYGERPPATATAFLHNCVSRLRRAVGPEVLETRAPGYVLHAAMDEVDAWRFERALSASRALGPSERVAALGEALSLWRGPALADFAFESFAEGEIARLEELRLIALEDRIEAELELGRHVELVAELEALVARHPLRERLRSAQMLALYRARRKPESLQAFQDARLALIEEHGLEPSQDLRGLEQRIHLDDPSLEAPSPVASSYVVRETLRPVVALYAEAEVESRADPEAMRQTTDRCAAAIRAAVERHGGMVKQLVHEEVVCFFGLPAAHEDDALRALRAAVEVRGELAALGAPARLALAAGDVLAAERSAPHAGAAVREGRQLKNRAAPGSILLAPSVLRLVGSAVDTVPVDATGDAFRLLRLEPDAPAVGPRFDSPLVGRELELERLHRAFGRVVERRRCERVVLVGDPGVGKSRVTRELTTSLAGRAQILSGGCVSYGEAARYLPLAEILRQGVGPGDPVPEELVPLLGGGLATALSPNVFRAVRSVLETASQRLPVVVVLEDLHLAAPMLLDLIEYLAGWAGELQILVLCVARPELLDARESWKRDAFPLEPFGEVESATLLRILDPNIGDERAAVLLRAAEGNPLFLEQLVAARGDGDGIPPTLETLLASRLDRLEAPARDLLGCAAIAGREFWRGSVEALTPEADRSAVADALASLVRQRFLRPAASSVAAEDAFVFHHVLLRDAAYASLPKAARADLHERLARWLDRHPDVADEVVGFHLEQAHNYATASGRDGTGLAREAAERLGAGGLAALKRDDPPATVDLLTRAVALLPRDDPCSLEFACELGTALKACGNYHRVERVFAETAETAALAGARQIELRARIELVWPRLLHGVGDLDDAIRLVEDAIVELTATGDDRSLERAWFCLAALRGRLQVRHAASEQAALESLRYGRVTGFSHAGCLTMLAADACDGPLPVALALPRCEGLLAEASSDRGAELGVRLGLACLLAMRGDFGEAREQLARTHALSMEFGFRTGLPRDVAAATAEVEALAGDAEAVEHVLRDACADLEHQGDTAWLATQSARLAEAFADAGRHAEGLELSERARALAYPGDVRAQVSWRRARARTLAHADRAAEAEPLAREALALLASSDELNEQAKTWLALAEVLRCRGRAADLAEAEASADALLVAKGNVALRTRAGL